MTPDGDAVVSLLDGRIAGRYGMRLLVRGTDVPELNAMLVRANIRVDGIVAERRTLEDVVLEVTGAGADRVDAR
jgi:ABC-2 type transport system ATP-binding protein